MLLNQSAPLLQPGWQRQHLSKAAGWPHRNSHTDHLSLKKKMTSQKRSSRPSMRSASDRESRSSSPTSAASMETETMVNQKLLFAVSARSRATCKKTARPTSSPTLWWLTPMGSPTKKKVFATTAANNGSQVNAINANDAAKSHTVGSIFLGALNALNR